MLNDLDGITAALDDIWTSVAAVCADLTDEQWDLPTACEGWTVKDQVSHLMNGIYMVRGIPQPPVDVPDLPHVQSDVARYMEQSVQARRPLPGAEVLAELRRESAATLEHLRGMDDDDWVAEAPGPMSSTIPRNRYLPIVVFDQWAHEQDIRRALGRPGHLDGPAAEHSRDRAALGLGHVLPAITDETEPTWVVFDISGPSAATFALDLGGQGPASPVAEAPAEVALTLRMPFEVYVALVTGRSVPDDQGRGAVDVDGDADLADRILGHLSVTP